VRHFRNIFFALVAFLWLPVSAHCELEKIPGLEFLRCAAVVANTPDTSDDCSSCCMVEKLDYRADVIGLNAPAPELVGLQIDLSQEAFIATLPDEVSVGVLVAAPPELFTPRHFLYRTALPARAPSLLS
jgi:hypothetical protein